MASPTLPGARLSPVQPFHVQASPTLPNTRLLLGAGVAQAALASPTLTGARYLTGAALPSPGARLLPDPDGMPPPLRSNLRRRRPPQPFLAHASSLA
ncbi:hypothetical protein E2562_031613 [Oryza meyeriana var. granulata]|uniref:Uncharacterized protein n=1 Tax=Oryza meyeriana var. granulata TaxID=110450 RepID=A0A6G1E5T0_9ORYZ|nr:hypothetical protein E2562_031613 [Oryza meyeriana var. granulata]